MVKAKLSRVSVGARAHRWLLPAKSPKALRYSIFLCASLAGATAAAEGHSAADDGPSHGSEDHSDHDHWLELGASIGAAYLLNEREFAAGLHAHALVAIGDTPWSLGVGYERLFDEHAHNAIGIAVQYRIIPPWSVNVSPGVAFSDEHPSELSPAAHVETAYEFLVGPFHLGPTIEAAFDKEDTHFTLGAHLGMGF